MVSIAIVGDGPAGLSAALFLAKNGQEVNVFGLNETAVHFAQLRNYLGIEDIAGSDFQEIARRQVAAFGARLVAIEVVAVSATATGFELEHSDGTTAADYLILAEGRTPALARSLGLETEDGTIVVDSEGRTSLDKVYVVGRSARPGRSQAIISAGAGASAALDILAVEAGEDVQDWDSVDD